MCSCGHRNFCNVTREARPARTARRSRTVRRRRSASAPDAASARAPPHRPARCLLRRTSAGTGSRSRRVRSRRRSAASRQPELSPRRSVLVRRSCARDHRSMRRLGRSVPGRRLSCGARCNSGRRSIGLHAMTAEATPARFKQAGAARLAHRARAGSGRGARRLRRLGPARRGRGGGRARRRRLHAPDAAPHARRGR